MPKVLGIVEKANMNDEHLYAYERFWDQVNREHVLAADGYKEGHAKGVEEGLVEGEKKGIRLTALKIKKKGLAYDLITEMTGLSLADIEALG